MINPLNRGFWLRLIALIRKETWQLLRDRSNLALGIVLPIVLILLFGYGLSLDLKNAPVAVVMEDASPTAMDIVTPLQLSPYISPVVVTSMHDAQQLIQTQQVEGIVRIPSDFSRQLAASNATVQLILNGVDANRANIMQSYIVAAINNSQLKQHDMSGLKTSVNTIGTIVVVERRWFNAANTSTWFLVPGLIVLVMTLVGALLTSMVVAREWERGTLEALFVTPVRPVEILLAKIAPYFVVGIIGLILCLLAARFLFGLPIYGSLPLLLLGSVLYLLVALGIGLLISCATKNQFMACQIAIISSFMPAAMLSGFMFDLRNVPLVIRMIGQILPATYYMELLKTLFLAGNVWPIVIKNSFVLAAYAVILLGLARFVTRKKLD